MLLEMSQIFTIMIEQFWHYEILPIVWREMGEKDNIVLFFVLCISIEFYLPCLTFQIDFVFRCKTAP